MRKYYLLFLLVLLAPAMAEVTECTDNSSCPSGVALRNLTVVTGAQGSTILFCSSNSDCVDTGHFKCFNDIDGLSSSSYTGWCNATSITSCYVNGTAYATSYNYCTSATAYRTCTSGTWGSSASCSGNQTCTAGTSSPCGTATTTTAGSSGNSPGTNTTTTVPSDARQSVILISSPISDFNLTQNESVTKSLIVKNNGNFSLNDVALSISGLETSWFSIAPSDFDNVTKNAEKTFTIVFSVPATAAVKSYSVTTSITTSNASATASAAFTLRVLPSNATVENTIIPAYNEYLDLLKELESNITALEAKGINTTAIRNTFNSIKDKLAQANESIGKKDYFAANQLLDSVKALVADIQSSIATAKEPSSAFDVLLIVIIIVIIAGAGIFLYMMWPTSSEGFHPRKGWQEPKKEETPIKKILEKIRKKREEQKYEFKT